MAFGELRSGASLRFLTIPTDDGVEGAFAAEPTSRRQGGGPEV
jgi:hypothetical protein